MNLSADAIMLGLDLMKEGGIPPGRLAELFRAVSASGVPDQVVALEERVLARAPDLASLVARLGVRPRYVPVDCPSCQARLRAPGEVVGPSSYCPLCGEAIVTARQFLFLEAYAETEWRAAEKEAPLYGLPRPQRFAHFELLRLLGRGGAGRVYEARNVKSGRTVAVKVLAFRPLESAADAFKRLRREARVAASVTHHNVVPVHDLGVAEGLPFIEMELIEGTSLREHLRREGGLPPRQACTLCVQALAGLAAVHEHGIVHGDVKPGNILLDGEGQVRLTDFGLSRFLEETTSMTSNRKAVGSPHFMAPEQWRGDLLTARTDLYAMGLVLYNMLTGVLPFEGLSLVAMMYRHLNESVLEAQRSPAAMPNHLARIIRRSTEKAPERRFQTCEAFAGAIRTFLEKSVVQ